MTYLLTLGASFPFSRVSWLLNFIETRHVSFWLVSTVLTYKLHWNYSISQAKSSLFDDCAGGSQGVQLLDWSNMSQVRAIRLRQVWVSWHPSIQSWSLWIGKSTCSCEPTLPETEPATSKGTLQVHSLPSTKDTFQIKITIGRQFG